MSSWYVGICLLFLVMAVRQFLLKDNYPKVSNALTRLCEYGFLFGTLWRAFGTDVAVQTALQAVAAVLAWQLLDRCADYVWGPTRRLADWKIIFLKRAALVALLTLAVYQDQGFIGVSEAFAAAHIWLLLKGAFVDCLNLSRLVTLDEEGRGVRFLRPAQGRRRTDTSMV